MSQSIKLQQTQQTQSCQKSHNQCLMEVDMLFARLLAIYGTAWSQNFPSNDILNLARGEWVKQLMSFAELDIERALQAIIESGEKYPPNLPVFVKHLNENKEQRRYKTYGAA